MDRFTASIDFYNAQTYHQSEIRFFESLTHGLVSICASEILPWDRNRCQDPSLSVSLFVQVNTLANES